MLRVLVLIAVMLLGVASMAIGQERRLRRTYPGFGSPPSSTYTLRPNYGIDLGGLEGLDGWRVKRERDFWNPTSPFFGDPYYDPLKTSPMSPFRSPQYHPWGASPFRGDPYYDPYAPRRHRLDFYRRR
jgi:hypothetical protein